MRHLNASQKALIPIGPKVIQCSATGETNTKTNIAQESTHPTFFCIKQITRPLTVKYVI